MADQQNRGGQQQRTNRPGAGDQNTGAGPGTQTNQDTSREEARQAERDRQNQDDPSRAPESGDQD